MSMFATSAKVSRNSEKGKSDQKKHVLECFVVNYLYLKLPRYGDIFSLYVGRTPVVILNSYELIKSTFDRLFKNFNFCYPVQNF